MSQGYPQSQIDADRIRLRVLQFETDHHDQRDIRKLTGPEHHALERVLDELHRMNCVAAEQRAEIDALQEQVGRLAMPPRKNRAAARKAKPQ